MNEEKQSQPKCQPRKIWNFKPALPMPTVPHFDWPLSLPSSVVHLLNRGNAAGWCLPKNIYTFRRKPAQIDMGLVSVLSYWCGGLPALVRTAEDAITMHERRTAQLAGVGDHV